jgi:hypothetical protein
MTSGNTSTMETSLRSGSGLYPTLLGDTWWCLDGAVQRLHASWTLVQAVGTFRVRQGSNELARTLARLAQLPTAGEAVHTELLVTPRDEGEEWRRSFAGRPLVSLQSGRPDGLLLERMGLVEMRFRLKVVGGGLAYQSTSASLCLGSLRVPLPRWFSPCVTARESTAGDGDQVAVSVEVRVPLLGFLIAYEGNLTRIEVQG